MGSQIHKIISSSLIQLLRPLVRILLRQGIPFATFADLAKWVYTDVASLEFGISGRKQTVSRVSIITGLSRKEVRRIGELSPNEDLGFTDRYNRAARVISGWLKDPHFITDDGKPRDLCFENDKIDASFTSLVKAYSGDVPPRAVLDELERAGVVERRDGLIRLLTKGYIPKRGGAEKLHILGMDVRDLISSIDHNLVCTPSNVFLQRQASYDNIPEDRIHEVKTEISTLGEAFITSVDKVMSTYDRDANPSVEGVGRKRAILGIYYFQE